MEDFLINLLNNKLCDGIGGGGGGNCIGGSAGGGVITKTCSYNSNSSSSGKNISKYYNLWFKWNMSK